MLQLTGFWVRRGPEDAKGTAKIVSIRAPLTIELQRKKEVALRRLADCGSVVVALSGGVDSAVLLALALEALGAGKVLAATGCSASLAAPELEDSRSVARRLGARHEVVITRELEQPAYRANRGDRCFHCREELFSILKRLARERGLRRVCTASPDLGPALCSSSTARRIRFQTA